MEMRTTLTIVLYLGALNYSVSSPPSPINVIFSSINLRNVLHWDPGNETTQNTHFTVQYAIYGDRAEGGGKRVRWRAVWQCRDTVRRWCDLTNETWDLEQAYYARVRAVEKTGSSKWTTTTRFEPKSDTSFGPPLVSVVMEENSAIISMNGPMRYQPDNHTPEVSMATLYPQMSYNLSVHNARRNQTRNFPVASSSEYKYHLMEYDTEYCFSAKTRFLSMPVPCQPSAWHCITTPQDPVIGQLQRVIVGIVVPSVCMCMLVVVGYLLCRSLGGKGHKRPHILELAPINTPHLTFSPENLNVILIPVINSKPSPVTNSVALSDPTPPKPQQPIPVLPPFPSYSLQQPIAFPEPEAPWEIESPDYGFVAAASEMNEEGKEGERVQRTDGDGGDGDDLGSGGFSEDVVRDSCERGESDHSATTDTSQLNPYLPQKGKQTRTETQVPTRTAAQMEMRTFVQEQTWSQVRTFSPPQTQVVRNLLEGGMEGDMEGGLCINKDPHTGFFHFPLLSQTQKEGGMKEEVEVEEGMEREQVPLLSPYASQGIEDTPFHSGQSNYVSNSYAVVVLATEQEEEEEQEEEGGTNCVNWDPETRKLVLPEMGREKRREGGSGGQIRAEKEKEGGMGRAEEEEEERLLKLESVLVRQVSEEKEEAQRGAEGGRETGWETDGILTSWDLVIQMDQ